MQQLSVLDLHANIGVLHFALHCAGSDEAGAKLLSAVTLHAARSADGVAVGRNGRLRLLPLPTPRWPDLLVVHAPEERCCIVIRRFKRMQMCTCA